MKVVGSSELQFTTRSYDLIFFFLNFAAPNDALKNNHIWQKIETHAAPTTTFWEFHLVSHPSIFGGHYVHLNGTAVSWNGAQLLKKVNLRIAYCNLKIAAWTPLYDQQLALACARHTHTHTQWPQRLPWNMATIRRIVACWRLECRLWKSSPHSKSCKFKPSPKNGPLWCSMDEERVFDIRIYARGRFEASSHCKEFQEFE